jgi:hypothetical protein
MTGLANFGEVLAAKQIDLLRELIPRLRGLALSSMLRTLCTCHSCAKQKLPLSQVGST